MCLPHTPHMENEETPVIVPEAEPIKANPLDSIKVTDEEKEAFFKSFLSDEPYRERISLFDGRFTAVVRSLTVQENDDVVRQIRKDVVSGLAAKDEAYYVKLITYRLALSLVELNGEPFAPEISHTSLPTDKDTYVSRKADKLLAWSVHKLAGLQDAFKKFELKLMKLTATLDDPVFWKAGA